MSVPVVASAQCAPEAMTKKVAGMAEGINMPAPSVIALG